VTNRPTNGLTNRPRNRLKESYLRRWHWAASSSPAHPPDRRRPGRRKAYYLSAHIIGVHAHRLERTGKRGIGLDGQRKRSRKPDQVLWLGAIVRTSCGLGHLNPRPQFSPTAPPKKAGNCGDSYPPQKVKANSAIPSAYAVVCVAFNVE